MGTTVRLLQTAADRHQLAARARSPKAVAVVGAAARCSHGERGSGSYGALGPRQGLQEQDLPSAFTSLAVCTKFERPKAATALGGACEAHARRQ